MYTSKYLLSTLKEAPADAEIASHKLMVRAGYIRKLASGLYTWLPSGKRVLRKVEEIVRREMDKTGALEFLAPMVTPAELWFESNRYDSYGDNLLRLKDRKQADFVLGPTHEEVFTALARNEITSYRQLPVNFYQIQTKFRDETRPRFGILRTREFIMKDAYSFHLDRETLVETYQAMHDAYTAIFNALQLEFRAVEADNGDMGGSGSKEFQVIARAGEDIIAYNEENTYAANLEKASALFTPTRKAATKELTKVATPNVASIDDVVAFTNNELDIKDTVKLLVVEGASEEHPYVAIALRGDHELNEVKANNHKLIKSPVTLANPEEIKTKFNAEIGSLGVINCPVYLIADQDATNCSDFATGANETGYHYFGANWERDAQYNEVADLRNVVEGDPSPDGVGVLKLTRGIECGHIFQLGDKYSKAMNANVINEAGELQPLIMGCYGIGVSRIVAAAIEQNHDEHGINIPEVIAPFKLAVIPVNYHKTPEVKEFADNLYQQCQELGLDHETLFEDRDVRLGSALMDADLIGIPYQIIIGNKNLQQGFVELKLRRTGVKEQVAVADLAQRLQSIAAI